MFLASYFGVLAGKVLLFRLFFNSVIVSVVIFVIWYITFVFRSVKDILKERDRFNDLRKENVIRYDFYKNKSMLNQINGTEPKDALLAEGN